MFIIKAISISFGFHLLPSIMYAEAPDKSARELAFVFLCWGLLVRYVKEDDDDEEFFG